MSHIFFSYSRRDSTFMTQLRDHLRAQGLVVWTDESLEPGTPAWEMEIDQAIQNANCVVAILSPDAKISTWVGRELAMAESYGVRIFPVLLRGDDRTAVHPRVISHQRVDATTNPVQALQQITTAIQHHLRAVSPSTPAPAAASSPDLTRTVSRVGAADFRSITDAIQQSPEGVRILVRPGLYRESLELDRPVEIVGDGPAADIIIETANQGCLMMQTDYAIVRGLTLRKRRGTQGDEYFAVDIMQGRLVLEDCDITSDSLACIAVHGSTTDPVIRNCRIHDGAAGGIFMYENAQGTITGCDIYGNGLSAIEIKDSSTPTIQQCQVHDGQQGGIYFQTGGRGKVIDCDLYGNVLAAIEIVSGGSPTIQNCRIYQGKAGGVFIWENGQGLITGCDIHNNELAGIEVKGDCNPTIQRCLLHDGKTGGVLFWQQARGSMSDCEIYANGLSGVQIGQGGNPTVQRCKIYKGIAGGVFVYEDSQGTLVDCDIAHNKLAGVEIKEGSNPTFQHCQIHEGDTGGVFVWENGQGVFIDCDIYANGYSGIESKSGAHPTLRQCRINRNVYQAVYVHEQGTATVENCDLTNNKSGVWFIEPGCTVNKSGNTE